MNNKRQEKYNVAVDFETFENLDWLKCELDSPKAWIVKKLVTKEVNRVCKGVKHNVTTSSARV